MADTKNWTWVLERRCPDCGFDAGALDRADIGRGHATGGRTASTSCSWAGAEVRRRPEPEVWSALEYGAHVRDVFSVMLGRLQLMLTEDDPTFANWNQDATAERRALRRPGSDGGAGRAGGQRRGAGRRLRGGDRRPVGPPWPAVGRVGLHRRIARALHGPRPGAPRVGRRAGLPPRCAERDPRPLAGSTARPRSTYRDDLCAYISWSAAWRSSARVMVDPAGRSAMPAVKVAGGPDRFAAPNAAVIRSRNAPDLARVAP